MYFASYNSKLPNFKKTIIASVSFTSGYVVGVFYLWITTSFRYLFCFGLFEYQFVVTPCTVEDTN